MSKIYTGKHKEWGISETGKTQLEVMQKLDCKFEDLTWAEMYETEFVLQEVPPEFRSGLSYMAYESGHSAGEEEVLSILRGLIHDLKPMIEAYRNRISPPVLEVEEVFVVSQTAHGNWNKLVKSQEQFWFSEDGAKLWFDKTEDWFKKSNAVFKLEIGVTKIEKVE